ncbi:MAG TPA: DNA translocase FtsK 4TM domain-containing protein, partial [Actinomycetota bacterium]|nr:DNA translocase FtsK 4TM domain-containing protein [Actinomycetota bacterium]
MAKTTRRASARRPSPSSRKRKRKPARTPTRQILSPWARDALGIGLVVFALLSVLSVWLSAAGPAGEAISWLLRGTVGAGAAVVPVIGVYWGVVLLREIEAEDRVRMFIGFAALAMGVLGILSVLRGNPSPASGFHGSHDAAGLVGAIASWPLSKVLSSIGSVIVCAGLAAIGALVFTGTPVSALAARFREFREARAEHDPVGSKVRELLAGSDRPSPRVFREPEEPVVILDAAAAGRSAFDDAEPEPPEPVEPRSLRGRKVRTEDGPYELPPLDLLRTAPTS